MISTARRRGWLVVFVTLAVAAAGCSGASRSADAFCDQLAVVTGPTGAEAAFNPGDPERLPNLVTELRTLLDHAPDDMATTAADLIEFFDAYQRAPRVERRTLLAENERRVAIAAEELNDYALNTCGLILQRARPTALPTVDPGIDVAPE